MVFEETGDGRRARVAWLIDLYIPANRRRQGFGTKLMNDLAELWARVGVEEAKLTATAEGLPAYEAWGFVVDHARDRLDAGLQPMRLKLS